MGSRGMWIPPQPRVAAARARQQTTETAPSDDKFNYCNTCIILYIGYPISIYIAGYGTDAQSWADFRHDDEHSSHPYFAAQLRASNMLAPGAHHRSA
eukprot:588496-Pleurochrysis_carterae.AAC.1